MSTSAVSKVMSPRPDACTKSIAIVGADGFVGSSLAAVLGAKRVVYGPCSGGDVHVSQAKEVLQQADIVINAGGFRVRPGCTYADYQRSHQGAAEAITPWIRKGALLLHISSASVMGSSKDRKLGIGMPPNPATFPSPAYATAKFEADQFVEKAAARQGFRAIFLLPAVVYAPQGAGMVESMLGLAKKGISLRLYPRSARHHLCHARLLVEAFRRVIEQSDSLPHLSRFLVADPYTVTNRELEAMIERYAGRKLKALPLPAGLLSAVLTRTFHSRIPKLDLKTWGEIFGVLNYDTEYDPSDTFRILGIDPAQYSIDKTLDPLIREAFAP
jgi:nucleoside-diphosphate-sugar epimerase